MKSLNLKWTDRLGLVNFISISSVGNIGKLTSLQRVLIAVRFTPDEAAQIKEVDLGNGTSRFETPDTPDFGALETDIEEGDAHILLTELEGYQNFKMFDLAWVTSVKDQLKAPSVKRKTKGK